MRRPSPWSLLRSAASLCTSGGAHLLLAAPLLLLAWFNDLPEMELIGDEGAEDGPVGDGLERAALAEEEERAPLTVSLYTDPAVATVEAPTAPAEVASTPVPAPGPPPSTTPPAAATGGSPNGDPARTGKANLPGRPPRGAKKPCESIEEITTVTADKWRIEREVVTYYAFHQQDLNRQVNVAPHFAPDGKADGAWIFLTRCSVLKQAGVKHKDVLHSVNGHPVRSLAEGVAAYIALIGEENLRVEVTRKGERKVLKYRIAR